MGKSAKKSAKKSASKVDSVPAMLSATESLKGGKREAEEVLELAENMKKQKKDNNQVVKSAVNGSSEAKASKKKTKMKAVVKQPVKEDSSDDEDFPEEELETKKNAAAVQNGQNNNESGYVGANTGVDGSKTSDEESEGHSDDNAPAEVISSTENGKKLNDDNSDSSDDSESEDEEDDAEMMDASTPRQQSKSKNVSSNGAAAQGSKTLFVGNLPFNVDQSQVEEFFNDSAEVVEVRLALDKDQNSKGFGHVEFATVEDAKKAMELNGQSLNGREVRLDFASERGAPGSFNQATGNGKNQISNVFVRGFDKSLSEDEIRSALTDHFSSCGEITKLSIPPDHENGRLKGMAYIGFNDLDSVKKALELDNSQLGDQSLTVQEAYPRGGGGGRSGGGRGGRGGRFGGRRGGGRFGGQRGGGRGRGRGGRGGRGNKF